MKGKSRILIALTALCMLACVYINIPAQATDGEVSTGFIATSDFDWTESGPVVSGGAVYSKELWADISCHTISLAYLETADGEMEYISLDNVSITLDGQDASEYVEVKAYEGNAGQYDLFYNKTGDYTFTYNGDSITVHVDYPQVGFYNSTTKLEANYVRKFEFASMDENTFYVILNAPEDYTTTLATENPFVVTDWETGEQVAPENLGDYISYELVSEGCYKATVNTQSGFGLSVNAVCQNSDGSDSWEPSMYMDVEYREAVEGLVVKDWIEWSDETGSLFVPDEAPFLKETWPELGKITLYLAYIEDETDETPETISPEDIVITYDGEDATDLVTVSANEQNGELTDFKFTKTGDYVVSYTVNDVTSSIILHVEYPMIGFYETAEMTEDGYIAELFEYTTGNNDELYMIINSKGAEITDPSVVANYYYEDAISSELVSDEDGLIIYKIIVTDERSSEFAILGRCMCSWEGEEPYEVGYEIMLRAKDMTGRLAFTDGESHVGYTGCYITKEEYEAGAIYWNNSTPIFWVHADTVQGVIDKLSAVANGEEVLYQKVDFAGPNMDVSSADVEITNTGYIYIAISQHGDINLQDQYVSSSGNMKGILFTSGKDWAYSVHDEENGFYIEDCVFNLDNVRALISANGENVADVIPVALANETYVSRYKDKLYYAEKVENGDQHYFTIDIDNPVEYAADETGKEALMLRYLDLHNIEGIAEMTPFFKYPEMHVNIYCDMKFTGRYEKLSIGFKEGKDFGATIFDQITGETTATYTIDDLGGATTKQIETTFGYDSDNGQHVVENTSVWLYTIDSEIVTSGTYEGEVDIAETPEPNAMPELTQEQKDAIEQSKKLTVDVEANAQSTDDIDEEVQDEIKKAIDDSSYSGAIYIDLNVNASVDGVEKDGKKVKTPITEMKASMEITIDIPEDARKGGRKYKVVRHHVDKHGNKHTEVIEGTLSDDGKKITFDTDCFSTYAIVYDSVDEGAGDTTTEEPEEETTEATEEATTATVTTEESTTTETVDSPKTGDNAPFLACIMMLMISGVGIICLNKKEK